VQCCIKPGGGEYFPTFSTLLGANCFHFTNSRPKQPHLGSTPPPASSFQLPAALTVGRFPAWALMMLSSPAKEPIKRTLYTKALSTFSTWAQLPRVSQAALMAGSLAGLRGSGRTSWQTMRMIERERTSV